MYRFHIPIMTFFAATRDPTLTYQLCSKEGTVTSFRSLSKDALGGYGCREWFYDDNPEGHVSFRGESIRRFRDGWCGVRAPIISLDLSDNNIVDITTGMLESLAPGLQRVILKNNKIERIRRGTIDRRDVHCLDLSHNSIQAIEIGALEHLPALQMLNLTSNQITDIKFVASLPIEVKWLFLNNNDIAVIPNHLFSSIPNLEVLELARNNIKRIGDKVLEGIFDLYYVDFSFNPASKNESMEIVLKKYNF